VKLDNFVKIFSSAQAYAPGIGDYEPGHPEVGLEKLKHNRSTNSHPRYVSTVDGSPYSVFTIAGV